MSREFGPNPDDLHEQNQAESDDSERSKTSAEDVYGEAHLINQKYGDRIKGYATAAEMNEKFGDGKGGGKKKEHLEELTRGQIEQERTKAEKILIDAAAKNVNLHPYFGNIKAGQFLYEKLRTDEEALVGHQPKIKFEDFSDFGIRELEYLGSKINQDVQTLQEPDGRDGFNEYPVVTLQETQDSYTFITNSTGIEGDNKARVFKMNKNNMQQEGYQLGPKTDFKSIFPAKNLENQSQSEK